jgi:hypothetical protein
MSADEDTRKFRGSKALGALAVILLGPLFLAGVALLAIGLLATFGVDIGPLREGDVPAWLDVLYGGSNGFKSFVAFLLGGGCALAAAGAIKWCFTGQWLKDWV